MREVNFSIPNGNRASVHITPTLYDRRALDCTSTLPLINSLNHLAYLTTSSARIRDILTVDGGVERLVCILKEGRSKDEMHMWKWNLAFQCIVNIGVRGSEAVRTRVVEADMVPVIATILWDYILVVEREKAQADAEQAKRNAGKASSSSRSGKLLRDTLQEPSNRPSFFERGSGSGEHRSSRRQPPPPSLDIPQPFPQSMQLTEPGAMELSPPAQAVFTSPPERTTFSRPQAHQHNRSHDARNSMPRSATIQRPATAVPSLDTIDGHTLRPVRDIDRLPSMAPPLHTGVTSNPESPTTPSAPLQRNLLSPVGRRMRRASLQQRISASGESEDSAMTDAVAIGEDTGLDNIDQVLENQNQDRSQTLTNAGQSLTDTAPSLSLVIPPPPEPHDAANFELNQQTPIGGSDLNNLHNPANPTVVTSPTQQVQPTTAASPAIPLNAYPNYFLRSAMSTTAANALMPRDEDVLMSLQLLAYISKYCDLRHYFQATHLVPRLRIDREVDRVYGTLPGAPPPPPPHEDELEEFLQPDDYNIFPLVEKFTVKHHSKELQYWACVVMRNLCRKDDVKGGIRQCANYQCGKWEEYTRQFAKCRRCRRTKYCSKECQRESWSMHRYFPTGS